MASHLVIRLILMQPWQLNVTVTLLDGLIRYMARQYQLVSTALHTLYHGSILCIISLRLWIYEPLVGGCLVKSVFFSNPCPNAYSLSRSVVDFVNIRI